MEQKFEIPKRVVMADMIVLQEGCVLMVKRKYPPFSGYWALPGGMVDENETVLAAAIRELREETGLIVHHSNTHLFDVKSEPGRDDRGPSVSTVWIADTVDSRSAFVVGDEALALKWFKIDDLLNDEDVSIAFDHREILHDFRSTLEEDKKVFDTLAKRLFFVS
jgi:8-oxo-dGTP diphosphatase